MDMVNVPETCLLDGVRWDSAPNINKGPNVREKLSSMLNASSAAVHSH